MSSSNESKLFLMKHDIWPLFSCPVFATKLTITQSNLNTYIKELNKLKYQKSNFQDPKVSLISKEYFLLNKPKFKILKKSIIETLKYYNNTYLKYKANFKMTTSWVAKTPSNSSSAVHNHSNNFLSGVYYLQAPKDCGNIQFNNMNAGQIQIPQVEESTIWNANQFHFVPQPNVLLFFPSWAYHQILENNSGKDRLSIAFNFLPCSSFGYQDSQIDFSPLQY